jgi:hypothetical protein
MHPLFRDTEPESRKINGYFLNFFKINFFMIGVPDILPDSNINCLLLLRITLFQLTQLRIFVRHAKNLPYIGREQSPDSYVKIYLRWGNKEENNNNTSLLFSPRHWKQKTKVIKNTQNPTYNEEVFLFIYF